VKYEKPQQMLLFELKNGKSIMTRIWAAQTLANFRNGDVVLALKESMANDPFWKVQAEVAKALGSINTEAALDALVQGASVKHPKARRAVVKALGEFKTEKAAEALLRVLAKDESYFVEAEAAKSLGKTKSSKSFDTLQDAFRTKDSFREVIKARILEGFGELKDERALPILLTATKYGQHFRIRQSATKALAKFGHSDGKAFERLTELLKDKNHHVRTAAIEALEEIREPRALADLDWVVEHELDGGVKRAARHAIFKIREHLEKSVEWRKLQDEIEQLKQENRRLRERIDTLESRMSKDKT